MCVCVYITESLCCTPEINTTLSSYTSITVLMKIKKEHVPGGPVVKNTPANAGDMGSNLSLGRFHVLWSNRAHAACHNCWACALQQGKPPQWGAHTLQQESRSHLPQLEKAYTQQWRPSTAKNKINTFQKKRSLWHLQRRWKDHDQGWYGQKWNPISTLSA